MNGVIHECDRFLRLANTESSESSQAKGEPESKLAEQPESSQDRAQQVTNTAAFYNVYGQALHQHWYDVFEKYLMFAEALLIKHAHSHAADRDSVLTDFKIKLALERQMSVILKLATAKFKKAQCLSQDVKLSGMEEASEDDVELVVVCSKPNSIKAELVRTYLLYLIFLPIRFEKYAPAAALDTLQHKFQLALTEGKIWGKKHFPEEVAEMLVEEVQFILDWLKDLVAISQRWNAILSHTSISETDVESAMNDPFEFDGDLQILENPEESVTLDAPEADCLVDLDGAVAYYRRASELLLTLI